MSDIIHESIKKQLNDFFINSRYSGSYRTGIHTTAIIATKGSFCYREQVLQLLFKNDFEQRLPLNTVRIMKRGDATHNKWQKLFRMNKNALNTEDQYESKLWKLTGTPDIIAEMLNRKWVIEIKSIADEEKLESMTKMPIGSERQLQIYMFLTSIPNGIVLYDDVSTSKFRFWITQYKHDLVKPYIERLYKIRCFEKEYLKSGRLPKRKEKCGLPDDSKPSRCAMAKACFGNDTIRRKLRK